MKPVGEVLNAIQDEGKRNQVKKLFEDFEVQKMLYAEPLNKLIELNRQKTNYLKEIEDNKLIIKEIEGSDQPNSQTGLKLLEEKKQRAEAIDDEDEVNSIQSQIDEENKKILDIQNKNKELEKLAKEVEQQAGNTKMALTSYFSQKRKIQEELNLLDNKLNIENIDSSTLKKSPPQKPVIPIVEDQREKRKPSWERAKETAKRQKTNNEIETSDNKINLIQSKDDKKFISDWWSDKGYDVKAGSDKVEIKNLVSNSEIVITDKAASTTSRDEKDLKLMTQQLVDQLFNKGKLSTANFKAKGPDADTLNSLFKQIKEEKLKQKNEFTVDPGQTQNDQYIGRARMGSMSGGH